MLRPQPRGPGVLGTGSEGKERGRKNQWRTCSQKQGERGWRSPSTNPGGCRGKGRDGGWQVGKKASAPSTKVSICQSSAPSQSSRLWLSAGQTRPAPGQTLLLKRIQGSREASLLLIYICKSSCLANTDKERRDEKAKPILRCFLEARRGNLSASQQQHRVQRLLLCGHCHKVCRRNPEMLGINVPLFLDRCTF